MSLFVKKAGLLTAVQDLGRYGTQKYGVVASGAMDAFALRTANLLVGNRESDACLEIAMIGPELVFERPALFSICGGDLSASLNGQAVPLWRTIYAPAGSRLTFGAPVRGCRAYLAVAGGLDVPPVMGSRSTFLRAGIGGYQGRALRPGDRVAIGQPSALAQRFMEQLAADGPIGISRWSVSSGLLPSYTEQPTLRIIEGEEYHLFDEESKHRLLHEPFTVLPQSGRMGYRLAGGELKLKQKAEMISAAVTFGTMQVPADGNPIVLMADRQTTGGYPKIAQVITVDLPLLAQVNLGGKVQFRKVSLQEAQAEYISRELALRELRCGLELLVTDIGR